VGAQAVLEGLRKRWPWVKHLFADSAYDRLKLMDKAAYLDFVVEIVHRRARRKKSGWAEDLRARTDDRHVRRAGLACLVGNSTPLLSSGT
jgi:hypothetical protein